MILRNHSANCFIPDGQPLDAAIARTTHLAIGAHQDDLEIMAMDGILRCFQNETQWFMGVVVTNGSGSPRSGIYANYTDEAMCAVRVVEQKKAAVLGEYGAIVQLGYASKAVKEPAHEDLTTDLKNILKSARPKTVYTHNPADKHDTHVATALRVIEAVRSLPPEERPETLLGCEVWRDLDWLDNNDKVAMDVSAHENLQAALLGVFDSQIAGGKRYDLATQGRLCAHATYFASHDVDAVTRLAYAMSLTPLIKDDALDIAEYVHTHIQRFASDVLERIHNF